MPEWDVFNHYFPDFRINRELFKVAAIGHRMDHPGMNTGFGVDGKMHQGDFQSHKKSNLLHEKSECADRDSNPGLGVGNA